MKKKTKKYAEGGLSGIANTAQSLMKDVNNAANQINYGSSLGSSSGSTDNLGFNSLGNAVSSGPAFSYEPRNPPGQTYTLSQRPGMPDVALFAFKKGGSVKAKPKMSSASKRADGCAMKGKTRGRMV